jgi:hypothetical protein
VKIRKVSPKERKRRAQHHRLFWFQIPPTGEEHKK